MTTSQVENWTFSTTTCRYNNNFQGFEFSYSASLPLTLSSSFVDTLTKKKENVVWVLFSSPSCWRVFPVPYSVSILFLWSRNNMVGGFNCMMSPKHRVGTSTMWETTGSIRKPAASPYAGPSGSWSSSQAAVDLPPWMWNRKENGFAIVSACVRAWVFLCGWFAVAYFAEKIKSEPVFVF